MNLTYHKHLLLNLNHQPTTVNEVFGSLCLTQTDNPECRKLMLYSIELTANKLLNVI